MFILKCFCYFELYICKFSVLHCLFFSDGICSLLSEGLTSLVFVMEIVQLLHAQGKKIQLCYISVSSSFVFFQGS